MPATGNDSGQHVRTVVMIPRVTLKPSHSRLGSASVWAPTNHCMETTGTTKVNGWLFSQEGGKVRASVFLPCESSRDARLRRFMAELRAAIPALSNPEDEEVDGWPVAEEELAGTGTWALSWRSASLFEVGWHMETKAWTAFLPPSHLSSRMAATVSTETQVSQVCSHDIQKWFFSPWQTFRFHPN